MGLGAALHFVYAACMKFITAPVLSFAFIASLALTGCLGYKPLYQTNLNVTLTKVVTIDAEKNVGERRAAQIIRQELTRRFPSTSGDQLYIEVEREIGSLAVREDATIERAQLTLNAYVRLTHPDGTVLWQTNIATSSSYNVETSPLSTDVGRTYASETAAVSLADAIAQRVYTFYAAQKRP